MTKIDQSDHRLIFNLSILKKKMTVHCIILITILIIIITNFWNSGGGGQTEIKQWTICNRWWPTQTKWQTHANTVFKTKRTNFKTDHYTPRNNSLNDKKFVLCTEDKRDTAVSPEHPYGREPVCSGTYTHTHTHTATGTPSFPKWQADGEGCRSSWWGVGSCRGGCGVYLLESCETDACAQGLPHHSGLSHRHGMWGLTYYGHRPLNPALGPTRYHSLPVTTSPLAAAESPPMRGTSGYIFHSTGATCRCLPGLDGNRCNSDWGPGRCNLHFSSVKKATYCRLSRSRGDQRLNEGRVLNPLAAAYGRHFPQPPPLPGRNERVSASRHHWSCQGSKVTHRKTSGTGSCQAELFFSTALRSKSAGACQPMRAFAISWALSHPCWFPRHARRLT